MLGGRYCQSRSPRVALFPTSRWFDSRRLFLLCLDLHVQYAALGAEPWGWRLLPDAGTLPVLQLRGKCRAAAAEHTADRMLATLVWRELQLLTPLAVAQRPLVNRTPCPRHSPGFRMTARVRAPLTAGTERPASLPRTPAHPSLLPRRTGPPRHVRTRHTKWHAPCAR